MADVDVVCDNCHSIFKRSKRRYNEATKYGWNQFCSKECHSSFKKKSTVVKCADCGEDVEITNAVKEKSKSGNFFCNSSCSAKYNNKRRKRSEESKLKTSNSLKEKYKHRIIHKNCKFCDEKFSIILSKKKVFCSDECRKLFRQQDMVSAKDELLNNLVNWVIFNGRMPVKRDFSYGTYSASRRFFGSWSNTIEELKKELLNRSHFID